MKIAWSEEIKILYHVVEGVKLLHAKELRHHVIEDRNCYIPFK